jgi:hypothetical protein
MLLTQGNLILIYIGWKANEEKMKTNQVPPQVEMGMSR